METYEIQPYTHHPGEITEDDKVRLQYLLITTACELNSVDKKEKALIAKNKTDDTPYNYGEYLWPEGDVVWYHPWALLLFYWEDLMRGILTGRVYRSLPIEHILARIKCMYGVPPRRVYRKFLDIRHAPREYVEVLLYIMGCVCLPVMITDLPPPLVFFLKCHPLGKDLVYRVCTGPEYRWICQKDVYWLEPVTLVEALIKNRHVVQVGMDTHRFGYDYKHPCCPLRAYQHGELRAPQPPSEKEMKVAPTTIIRAATSVVENVNPKDEKVAVTPIDVRPKIETPALTLVPPEQKSLAKVDTKSTGVAETECEGTLGSSAMEQHSYEGDGQDGTIGKPQHTSTPAKGVAADGLL